MTGYFANYRFIIGIYPRNLHQAYTPGIYPRKLPHNLTYRASEEISLSSDFGAERIALSCYWYQTVDPDSISFNEVCSLRLRNAVEKREGEKGQG